MAIEFHDGFENGVPLLEWLPAGGLTHVTSGPPRSGTYCAQFITNNGALWLPASAKKTVGFAINFAVNYPTDGSAGIYLASVHGDNGSTQHMCLTIDGTGHIKLRRGGGNGTVLATSTATIAIGVWRYVEFQTTIHDSTGTAIVRLDGVEIINFTGDTKNGGTNLTIDAFAFSTNSNSIRYDDVYVTNGTDDTANTGRPDDGFLGDVKVEGLLATGDGASSQWLGSDGNSVSNYLLVDDPTPNTSDYVGTSTVGNRDAYQMADLSAFVAQVFAIRTSVYAAKSDAGAAFVKVGIRDSGGTYTFSTSQSLSTSWALYSDTLRKSKPGGGAWSVGDINGLQAAIEHATS